MGSGPDQSQAHDAERDDWYDAYVTAALASLVPAPEWPAPDRRALLVRTTGRLAAALGLN